MISGNTRELYLKKIKENIQKHGYHLYVVVGGQSPRYAYTIGLTESPINAELVFAGGYCFDKNEVKKIIDYLVNYFRINKISSDIVVDYKNVAKFKFKQVDQTWVKAALLGCVDYYSSESVSAYQITPCDELATKEIPDMSRSYDINTEPIWRWLTERWGYNVPNDSIAATNSFALTGAPILEVSRWEDNYWEAFSFSVDLVEKDDVVILPLGVLLGMDATLEKITKLNVGESMCRDNIDSPWKLR